MGGNPTHFGYKRDPADYERAIQQQGAQLQNLTNLFNQFLEAFGINIGPTGETIILQEMSFIERTDIHNQIVEFIENLLRESTVIVDNSVTNISDELIQQITNSVIQNINTLDPRVNVWEAYTGS